MGTNCGAKGGRVRDGLTMTMASVSVDKANRDYKHNKLLMRREEGQLTVDPLSSSMHGASILNDTTLPVACTPLSVLAALVQPIL
jgi:hypothetical protein